MPNHRQSIASLEEQVRLMEMAQHGEGGFGTHTGSVDTTSESIERARLQIATLRALVDKHDPEGFTALR